MGTVKKSMDSHASWCFHDGKENGVTVSQSHEDEEDDTISSNNATIAHHVQSRLQGNQRNMYHRDIQEDSFIRSSDNFHCTKLKDHENLVPSCSELESELCRKFHSDDVEAGLPCSGPLSDKRVENICFSFFKTEPPAFDKHTPHLPSKDNHISATNKDSDFEAVVPKTVPSGCYLDASKGPELDILKDPEEALLRLDRKWPFLLRFPIACFGISLGLGSQTILWKILATSSSMQFLHIPTIVNMVLWFLAVTVYLAIFVTYLLKSLLYFEAVRREYYHTVRMNFFFAPCLACMFLILGIPNAITTSVHHFLWFLPMVPIFILELKIYGQWLSGGKRRLSKVANPCTHLALIGNFVGALLASEVGSKEVAIFFWAVGIAHYMVLFVTLYQKFPDGEVLPRELHPVFFLFVAPPCAASTAWESIVGDFDLVSRLTFFVGLFLYFSLVVRLKFFCGFRFSIAWWAYTFPMTTSSIAAISYSDNVTYPVTQALAATLVFISVVMNLFLFVSTIFHAFFWGTLFPNDMVIAMASKQPRRKLKLRRRYRGERNGKYYTSNCKDAVHEVNDCPPSPTRLNKQ